MRSGLHLHFDAPSGIAGDMVLGALIDLGLRLEDVEAVVRMVLAEGWRIEAKKGKRGGLVGTDVKVIVHDHGHDHGHGHGHGHAHRHYGEIREMLERLPGDVQKIARGIFERIAVAEAKLHGKSVDEVAFHEVGAIDSIVDIVGTAAALSMLQPASVSCTPLPLGHGTVKCAHGVLPVPAPATVEILAAAGVPTEDGGAPFELTTPTGAAIAAEIVNRFGPMPAGKMVASGWGAGDRELPDRPNLLRAVLLEAAGTEAESVVEVRANIDDMNPQLADHVIERLFAAGALDVWLTPVTMKKSRPGLLLGVLAPQAALDAVCGVIFAETSTIGLRHQTLQRRVLDRRLVDVDTPYGSVPVKVASLGGRVMNAAPEYDACRRIAAERGVPLKEVLSAAAAAARSLLR